MSLNTTFLHLDIGGLVAKLKIRGEARQNITIVAFRLPSHSPRLRVVFQIEPFRLHHTYNLHGEQDYKFPQAVFSERSVVDRLDGNVPKIVHQHLKCLERYGLCRGIIVFNHVNATHVSKCDRREAAK